MSEVKQLTCPICNQLFRRRVPIGIDTKRRYCSPECKHKDGASYKWSDERKIEYSKKMQGVENPNYGNKWSEEQKSIASARTIKKYEEFPELRILAGSANRGVKFDELRRMNISLGKLGITLHPHSLEAKQKIGLKSKAKWTPEYLSKHRGIMESLGYWTPLDCKSEFDIYYEESNWIGSMVEYFSESELFDLKKFGFFNTFDNTRGYVRDHIFPRTWGFIMKISPMIIRHPANMAFIPQVENVKKGFIDRRATTEHIKAEFIKLIEKIKAYKAKWCEHEKCLEIIRLMESENGI